MASKKKVSKVKYTEASVQSAALAYAKALNVLQDIQDNSEFDLYSYELVFAAQGNLEIAYCLNGEPVTEIELPAKPTRIEVK